MHRREEGGEAEGKERNIKFSEKKKKSEEKRRRTTVTVSSLFEIDDENTPDGKTQREGEREREIGDTLAAHRSPIA